MCASALRLCRCAVQRKADLALQIEGVKTALQLQQESEQTAVAAAAGGQGGGGRGRDYRQ